MALGMTAVILAGFDKIKLAKRFLYAAAGVVVGYLIALIIQFVIAIVNFI